MHSPLNSSVYLNSLLFQKKNEIYFLLFKKRVVNIQLGFCLSTVSGEHILLFIFVFIILKRR